MARKTTSGSSAERIAKLEAELKTLKEESSSTEILPTDYIKVMSLIPYPLNLSTRERGQGKVFKFSKFGEVKKIIYSDLLDIIEVHRNFLEFGYFIILDQRVVRSNGLDDTYSKILTKDKIDKILDGDLSCVELYSSCNSNQQEVIIEMVVEKLKDNSESIDLNLVDRLSRVSGIDISERANEARKYLEEVK